MLSTRAAIVALLQTCNLSVITTVRDIPIDRCPMKRVISDMFHSENMCLKSTKKNALIDFLSVLPEIATTACSKDNIKHVFIQAGIIYKEFNRYPIFNRILATCRQQPTLEEYRTVLESFETSLRSSMKWDTLMKSSTAYTALGWTRISTDKMFSEQQVLRKRVFNARSVSLTFTKSVCIGNVFK